MDPRQHPVLEINLYQIQPSQLFSDNCSISDNIDATPESIHHTLILYLNHVSLLYAIITIFLTMFHFHLSTPVYQTNSSALLWSPLPSTTRIHPPPSSTSSFLRQHGLHPASFQRIVYTPSGR